MKRTTTLLAIGVATGAVAFGAVGAGASTKGAKTKAKAPVAKVEKLQCGFTLIQQPAPGETQVLPAESGEQYGRIKCDNPAFGWGVIYDTFKVPDSGDTVAKYTVYLKRGSYSGVLDLSPGSGDELSDQSFTSANWSGTMSIRSTSGIYKGLTVNNGGKGRLNCSSSDSVHLLCLEQISMLVPPSVTPPHYG